MNCDARPFWGTFKSIPTTKLMGYCTFRTFTCLTSLSIAKFSSLALICTLYIVTKIIFVKNIEFEKLDTRYDLFGPSSNKCSRFEPKNTFEQKKKERLTLKPNLTSQTRLKLNNVCRNAMQWIYCTFLLHVVGQVWTTL